MPVYSTFPPLKVPSGKEKKIPSHFPSQVLKSPNRYPERQFFHVVTEEKERKRREEREEKKREKKERREEREERRERENADAQSALTDNMR